MGLYWDPFKCRVKLLEHSWKEKEKNKLLELCCFLVALEGACIVSLPVNY
jgi:hypothetical protein